jgi:hypothetical protein
MKRTNVLRVLLAVCLVVVSKGVAQSAEPAILAGFELWPEGGLERIGIETDSKHGHLVLSDIEAFFLLCRKDQKADDNWPPRRRFAPLGKPLRIAYKTDKAKIDCAVVVNSSVAKDGESIVLTIESPTGSEFTLKEKIEISVPNQGVVYLPSQKLIDGKQLYLYLKVDIEDQ